MLGIATTAQLSWVVMLLFVQFVQLSRGMTTYENMHGITELPSAVISSTGVPLDPDHPVHSAPPAACGHGHHNHHHAHDGCMRNLSRLLGVDPFIETVRGTGAATMVNQRRKNPFSRGCITNCRDFWCDPSPLFGARDSGAAMLGGEKVNYMDMYESPTAMSALARRRGGYEAVAEDIV
jgi:palmitoyltransferase